MRSGPARYTPQQRAEIVRLREEGLSKMEIAKRVGCSKGLVAWECLKAGAEPFGKPAVARPIRPMQRSGHTIRPFTPDDDALLLQLESEGLTYMEIARRMGRKRNSIWGRLLTLARHDAIREEQA